ncbi:hypothetical protein DV515_00009598 [Chloebia gouldiae]|uniref:Peptidase M12B propeptide domain-containing protein n=1 Tax=Chloebia gouldiae TaxID=44316 RepID=A0A3L8SBI8_CHLGU|nr:hypothetical protein DV515_00009598 [Chloebia gouldiae]
MQLAPLALALTTLFIDGLRTGARRQKLHPRQAQLLEKLSEYEIVTPTRVNEFGEPFPTDVHFRRRRRSTSAAPDAWTAAAADSPKAHYRLSAFGQQFLFNLTASSAFIAPLFTVSLLGEPAADQRRLYAEAADADVKHCFYRGHVNARPRLTAVISLCSGMLGTFKSDDGDYFVEPLLSLEEQEYEEEHNKPHLVYRHRTPPTNSSGDWQTCNTPAVSAPFFEIRCRRLRTVGKKHGNWHIASVTLGGTEQQITRLIESKVEEEEKRNCNPKKRKKEAAHCKAGERCFPAPHRGTI